MKCLFGWGMTIAAIPIGIGANILVMKGLYGVVSNSAVYLIGWGTAVIVAALLLTIGPHLLGIFNQSKVIN